MYKIQTNKFNKSNIKPPNLQSPPPSTDNPPLIKHDRILARCSALHSFISF